MAAITTSVSSYPTSYDSGYVLGSSSTNLGNACTDATSTTSARLHLATGSKAESYIFYNFNLNIPTDATINSVSCQVKAYFSNVNNTLARQLQLYSGATAKGNATTINQGTSTYTLSVGDWTATELNAAKLRFYGQRATSATSTTRYCDLYGATLTVSYTYQSQENTIHIKVSGTWKEAQDVKVKVNGSWQSVDTVYKKVNGSWQQQSDKSAMFDQDALYVSG